MSKLTVALPVLALATTAAVLPTPTSIPLPEDIWPEGIATGTGTTFYAGSLRDGDIFVGDLRTGEVDVLVDNIDGQAVGLKVDERRHRLFVAGGFSGLGLVYDTRDGSLIAQFEMGPFMNDVVVTKGGAYFTDTANPVLYKVPIAPDGTLGEVEAIDVTGPAATSAGLGLNGIDAIPNGDTLIVDHTGLGQLYTVDPETGASALIELAGGSIPPDTLDGILLDGKVLWAVSNFANQVFKIRLAPDLSSGVVTDVLTNDEVGGLFRVPTTVAEHGSRLVVVNGRFDVSPPPPFGPRRTSRNRLRRGRRRQALTRQALTRQALSQVSRRAR